MEGGIDIWNDPWFPKEYTRKTITPRGHHLIRQVSELLDPITEDWDVQLVRDT
jgi:hypothetical protein